MRVKKKILVTGGAGFIGWSLCNRLLDDGHNVICVDNLSSGSYKNVEKLLEKPGFTFYEHDVIHPYFFEVDQIYNLACPASPVYYQKDPIHTMKTSVQGAINALEIARATGAKILQTSTSEIYGNALEHPQKESYWGNVNPIGPRACYDEGKRLAETLFFEYRRAYSVDTRIVRIFNTYGPHMRADDGRVVSNFIVQALNNKPLTVYGKGEQTRSFCYIMDLVEGLIRCMELDCPPDGPVNLGNPEEYTIIELAEKVIEMTSSKSIINYNPLPVDDPNIRRPSIEYAEKILDWHPTVQLEEGLRHTIQYFAHQ